MDWDFVVYVDEVEQAARDAAQGGSFAASRAQALERDAAFAAVAGDDPRPLLVMRECGWCEGSDDALLDTRLDNEKTLLLSTWFHTVKLPNHVLQEDHAFRNLFEGEEPAHLFLATRDGRQVLSLSGQQSQTELWGAMLTLLDECYDGDPERVVKQLYRKLDALDELDEAAVRYELQLDEVLEDKGPGSSKAKKLGKRLAGVTEERGELLAEIAELRDLPLVDAAETR